MFTFFKKFLYFFFSGDTKIKNSVFEYCGSSNSAAYAGVFRLDRGGVFFIVYFSYFFFFFVKSTTVVNCSFISCYSGGQAGGLNLQSNVEANISSCSFYFCSAGGNGGAIECFMFFFFF
jgi:hypothetical protein